MEYPYEKRKVGSKIRQRRLMKIHADALGKKSEYEDEKIS
jgi:hypothetical protein